MRAGAAPTLSSATAVSKSQINLKWVDKPDNETAFKIERATSQAGPYSLIATVGANTTTYSNTGLTRSTTYWYRLKATNSGGDSVPSNSAGALTPAR